MSSQTNYGSGARTNIEHFYQPIEMPGSWPFNHAKTLRFINLYYNSQFESGTLDNRGFRKYFYNINKAPCDIATKFIDLDTKDVILVSEKTEDDLRIWLLNSDLKQWMKKEKFALLLNEIGVDYPKYGSVVIKKVNGKLKKVNLENLRLDPATNRLENSPFVYEAIHMTKYDIDKMPWDEKAKKELYNRGVEAEYVVYDCYELNLDGDIKWKRKVVADLYCARTKNGTVKRSIESSINDDSQEYLPAIILHEDEVDELPYRELHWEQVPGRWLGRGNVELLFDAQIAENEAENLERKGLLYTSLHIYQTRDDTVGRNILTDVENGDILKVLSEVTPVQNEERNLPAFNATRARWGDLTNKLTFSFDIARGEEMPSRTPLGVANLQAGMVASFFDMKRENFGIFLKDILLNDIIPDFKKQNRREHVLTLASNDTNFDKVLKAIVKAKIDKGAFDYATNTGFLPSQEQRDRESQRLLGELQGRKNVRFEIDASFYEDAKYHVDVITTGEQINTAAKTQALNFLLQLINNNPMVLQNKASRTILFKTLELVGVSPLDLNLIEDQVEQAPPTMPMATGGSMSGASLPTEMMANTQQRL